MTIIVIEKGYSSLFNKTNKISISEAKQVIFPVIMELFKHNIPFQIYGSIGLSIYCIEEKFQNYWKNRKTDDVEIIIPKKYWKKVKEILTSLGFEEDYTKNYIKIKQSKKLRIIHPFVDVLIFKKNLGNKEFYLMVLDKNSKITIIKNGNKITFSPIVTDPPEIGIIIGKIIRLSSKDKKDLKIIFLSKRIISIIEDNLDLIVKELTKYKCSKENIIKIINKLLKIVYGLNSELINETKNINNLKSLSQKYKSKKLKIMLDQKEKLKKDLEKRIETYKYAIEVLNKLLNRLEKVNK